MTKKIAKQASQDLVPIDEIDAKDGPKMRALPSDRHRSFVRALYQVRPGHGAQVKAARLAGFGTETSTPQSMAVIASRLMHDERVLEAIREFGERFIRGASPIALKAAQRLILDPKHKDHARAIGMVLDREFPLQTIHNVKVEHEASASMMATAEVFAKIMELATRARVPPMIDVTPERAAS